MVVVEHFLFGLKLLLVVCIEDVPASVQEAIALRSDEQRKQAALILKEKLHKNSEDALHKPPRDGHRKAQVTSGAPPVRHSVYKQHFRDLLSSRFGLNPLAITGLLLLPSVLNYLRVSMWIYIPISSAVVFYWQSSKDRHDRKAAIGLLVDNEMLQRVTTELPGWAQDSSYERVDWIVDLLQSFWDGAKGTFEAMIKERLLEALNKVPRLKPVEVVMCKLGNVAPKMVGVRFHPSAESLVRLDAEIKWSSDARVGGEPRSILALFWTC